MGSGVGILAPTTPPAARRAEASSERLPPPPSHPPARPMGTRPKGVRASTGMALFPRICAPTTVKVLTVRELSRIHQNRGCQ
eukprot:scaffold723_cov363-Prasinococcus_capsulatus_cf.AAC.19